MRKYFNKIRVINNFLLAFALVFYQLCFPLVLVRAEANANDNQTNENVNSNGNGNENENNNDNDNSDEPEETCDVKDSELNDYCEEELDCDSVDKCLVKNTCGEIKKCLAVEIENENETEVNNNVNSSSDTGKNEIVQEDSNSNENENCNDNCDNSNANANENGNVNCNANSNGNENSNNNTEAGVDPPVKPEDDSTAEIDTGDAVATSDVYNEVNTNIVSDNYQETVINIEGTYNGDINLLDQFNELAENNTETETGSLTVTNKNEAEVTNDIEVSANTGENTIDTEGGDASIQTGDAVAASNTVNVVNTNIVGNNVLFAVVNVYGEWNGDLIVPGEGLLEVSPEPVYSETVIVNENEAVVENNANVEANSGENQIASEGDGSEASILTGAAYAGSEVINIVNTNIVKNNFFFLMINNMGSWTGKILNWSEEDGAYTNIFSYDFGVLGDGETPTISGLLAIFNKNSATVENNVNVSANSGGNSIETEGDGSQAQIQTGNSIAMSKIINFINTNIIGNNWIFAIVNVMGQWNGNAVFAYPDLSISISDGKDQAGPGDNLDYTVTYKNNGKAACDNVNILVSLPNFVSSNGELNFSLAGLKPGEEKSFSVSAKVSDDIPEGSTSLESAAGITTGTKEVEMGNNMASDTTTANKLTPAFLAGYENLAGHENEKNNPKLTIYRDVKDSRVHAGDTVVYNIFVKNSGDTELRDVTVLDEMKLKSDTMANFAWNLGDMKPGKKLRIQYKLAIHELAPAGIYRSTALAYGFDPDNNKISANEDSQKVTILGNPLENVTQNEEYYTTGSYFTYGDGNITGGICFLDHWPAEDIIGLANAAGQDTVITGATDNLNLPLWNWLAVAAAYFLAINWALFPKKKLAIDLAANAVPMMFPAEVEEESFNEEYLNEEIYEEEINEKNVSGS